MNKHLRNTIIGTLTGIGVSTGVTALIRRHRQNTAQTFGIICAMESEAAPLREAMTIKEELEISGLIYAVGTLMGQQVVLVQCGIGKVNAALCAEAMCTFFEVDYLINSGVAGTPRSEVKQGDIVISTQAVHHDMDVTGLGYAMGEVPDMDITYFEADSTLIRLAREAATVCDLEGVSIFEGTIASGDQFIDSAEKTAPIVANFDPYAVEMEGAAMAHVAHVNQVPFVIIRAISDNADGNAPLSYPEFLPIAAHNSCAVMKTMLELA